MNSVTRTHKLFIKCVETGTSTNKDGSNSNMLEERSRLNDEDQIHQGTRRCGDIPPALVQATLN